MYHGSDQKNLQRLDPSKGVYHPEDWAGAEETGVKIEPKVVWITPDWDLAVAFALKGFVEDLVVDAATKKIYLQAPQGIDKNSVGYVYTISPDTKLQQINPWEYYSREPVEIIKSQPVTVENFHNFLPIIVAKLPEIESE